jgi:hypothetical protein
MAHPIIIDALGKYLTADNHIVTITSLDGEPPFKAIGHIHLEKTIIPNTWKLSGQYNLVKMESHPRDIVCKYHEPTP